MENRKGGDYFFQKNLEPLGFMLYICTHKKEETFLFTSGCGVIGSHARLRIWCREAWGFESLHPHKYLQCENSSAGRAQPCQG